MNRDELGEDDPVVPGCIEIPDARGFAISALVVEPAGRLVIGPRRRLDDDQTSVTLREPELDLGSLLADLYDGVGYDRDDCGACDFCLGELDDLAVLAVRVG